MMTQAHHDISYSTRDDDPSNDTLMSATDDSLKSSKLNVSNHNDESRQSPPTNDINRISENQPSSHNSTAIYKLHNSQKSVDSKSPSIPSANSKNRRHLQLDVEDGSDLSSVNSDGLSDLSESEDGDDGQRINDSGSDEDSVGNVTDNSDGSTVYSSSPPRRNAKPRSRSHSSSSSIDYTSSSNTDLSSSSVNSDDDIEGEQSSLRNPSHKSKSHTSRGRGHRRRGRPPKVHSISRSAHSSPPSSRQTSPSGHQKKPSSLHRRPGRRSTTNPDHFDIEDVHRRDRSGRTPIFRFAVKGDLEAVNKLIQAGADVNVKDYAGWTSLHESIVHNHHEIVKLLLENGANPNAQSICNGDSPLHDAAECGPPETVKLLLQFGASTQLKNERGLTPEEVAEDDEIIELLRFYEKIEKSLEKRDSSGQTFLHRLCSKGDLEMVTELVTRRRIPVNPKDNAGWTPLHEAALEGHTEIARILILRGATVNSKGFRNDTPLHDASSNGHYDLVKLLLEFGADPNATNDEGQTPAAVATIPEIQTLLKDFKFDPSKLPRVIHNPATDIFRLPFSPENSQEAIDIKQEFQEPNSRNHSQSQSRHRRSVSTTSSQSQSVASEETGTVDHESGQYLSREERKIQAYLATFAKLEKRQERSKKYKQTRYGQPSSKNEDEYDSDDDREIANSSRGRVSSSPRVSSHRKTHRDNTPSSSPRHGHKSTHHSGSSRKSSKRKQKKSKYGSLDINHRDGSGRTYLHKFSAKGKVDVVKDLIKRGASCECTDNAGWTPLHEAALRGHHNVVKVLLAHGADPNAPGFNKDTPLHDAVANGHTDVALCLLDHGAEIEKPNAEGTYPLDVAKDLEDDGEMEELLRKALDERKKTVVKSEESSSSRNMGSKMETKEPTVTVKSEELEPPSRQTVEEEQHSGKENDLNRVVGESEVSETEPESDAEAFPAKRKGPSPHKPAKRIKLDDSPSPKSKSPEKVQISSTVPTKPTLAESKPLPKAKAASPISDTPSTAETKTRPPVKPAEVKKSEPPPSSVLPPTQQRATLSRSGSQEPVAHSSKSRSSVSEATNDSVSSKPVRDSTVKVKKKVKRPFLMGISGYQKIGMEQPVVVSTPSIREDEGKTYFDDRSKEKSKADGSVTPARVKEEIEVKMEVVEEPLTVKPSTDVKEKSVAPSATAMLPSKSAKDSGDSMDVNEDSTLNVSPKQKVPRRPSPSRDPLPPNKKVKLAHPDLIAPPSVPPSTKPISSHAVYFPLYTIQIPPSTCYYLLDIQLSLLLNLSSPMEFISQHETVTVREATLSEKKSLKSTVIADFVSKHWKNRQGKKTKELLSSDLESLSMRFLRLDQVLGILRKNYSWVLEGLKTCSVELASEPSSISEQSSELVAVDSKSSKSKRSKTDTSRAASPSNSPPIKRGGKSTHSPLIPRTNSSKQLQSSSTPSSPDQTHSQIPLSSNVRLPPKFAFKKLGC